MQKLKLSNGIKLIYEKVPGHITSFTIGFEAGANEENRNNLGIAHATEHMVFKGTTTKSEKEINDLCNEYLGFHNAMTNYPYVVYYGSCLKEDFIPGFSVYFDIVFNPAFKEEGFKEEIAVILEELKEWSDDVVQHCEDMLFYNAFEERRLKELIIGTEATIKALTLEDLKNFHREHYTADNCVISVVTSLELNEVVKIIENEIGKNPRFNINKFLNDEYEGQRSQRGSLSSSEVAMSQSECPSSHGEVQKSQSAANNYHDNPKMFSLYENPKRGIFEEENSSINGCKVQYIFPIHDLSEREITLLHLFNEYFASGTSSILYDEIRTKRGLVYDIQGKVKNEKGIKLYTITLSTSKENIKEVKNIIEKNIQDVKNNAKSTNKVFNEEFFKKYSKNQNRKRMLALEKSIVMSMHLAVYEIMHSGAELLLNEFSSLGNCSEKEVLIMINKLFQHESIGIIKN